MVEDTHGDPGPARARLGRPSRPSAAAGASHARCGPRARPPPPASLRAGLTVQTHEIRRRFLAHFENAGHTPVPSASLILDDPTLLFVNAGMVQFKPYFLGEAPAPYATATSIQKCVRTGDIENVGHTTRHNTFFQMAGNFSFGDYFKEGAIRHAWTLVTGTLDDGGYGFDPERIWVTVFENDDEAERLWQEVAGLPPERIQRRDGRDNYWDMGIPGPGGPCSEIYYDRGPEHGLEGGPVADEDRYVEIWNLVFMQDIRGEASPKYGAAPDRRAAAEEHRHRARRRARRVPAPGRGERLRDRPAAPGDRRAWRSSRAARYDDGTEEQRRPVPGHRRPRPHRRHAHRRRRRARQRGPRLRAAPAAAPRRAQRPAARRHRAGARRPRRRSCATPWARRTRRSSPPTSGSPPWCAREEEAFLATLATGSRIFETRGGRRPGPSGSTMLPGASAFALHDTYGFPIDLTLEMAAEAGLDGRRGRLPLADGRAAVPRQGRRRRPQARRGRRQRLPRGARARRAHRLPRLHRPSAPRPRSSGSSSTASACPPRARATTSRSCSTAPRSTPRAAASRPTPGGSSATGSPSRSPTCSRRCPGCRCTAARRARRGHPRRPGLGPGRHRAPRRDLALAHRHPPRARRDAQAPSATPPPRPGRSTPRGGCASTSPRPRAPCRPACSPTSRTRSTPSCSATTRCAPSSPRWTRPASSARSRCSARSTATRCASSRSATTPASSAAAPTWAAPGSSAW